MIILGIETSCDETSVAIIEGKEDRVRQKSNIVASSLSMHAKTGGVIPEIAARAQLKFILPVLQEALEKALQPQIDAIAVTHGPGLIGPLLIGVETARTLSFVWKKPVIPVNHMMGHIYANFINSVPKFPILALVVSGGHTDLILLEKHGSYKVLGGTRDDAAGEAFDKIGRLLGLDYPAGPVIEARAKKGSEERFKFPRPLLGKKTYDFSFSGLKTAVLREVKNIDHIDEQTVNDIAAGTQRAIIEVLVKKTLRAAEEVAVKSIVLSGGVAANQTLRDSFQTEIIKANTNVKLYYPPKNLCTDNGAMIATAAYFNPQAIDWKELTVNPELYYE